MIASFLESSVTYCDEIFEYLEKNCDTLVSELSDDAMSHIAILETATKALLKRIRASNRKDARFVKKLVCQ
jgi:hypothetical protein